MKSSDEMKIYLIASYKKYSSMINHVSWIWVCKVFVRGTELEFTQKSL